MSAVGRPTPWAPPPDGFHYKAVEQSDWQIPAIGAGRCRFMVGRKACGRPAAATLMRGIGRKAHPWDYCDDPEHLYGRWIEDSKVMGWRLVKDDS